VRTSYT